MNLAFVLSENEISGYSMQMAAQAGHRKRGWFERDNGLRECPLWEGDFKLRW